DSFYETVDDAVRAAPLLDLEVEIGESRVGDAVVRARLAGGRDAGGGAHELRSLESLDGRVQGRLLDGVVLAARRGDALSELVRIGRPRAQQREHHEVDIAADGICADH